MSLPMDPTIVRQYQSKPRTTGKIEGRERGTEEWTLYDTQKAAAVAAGMDPTLVNKILAGTVTKKYEWEFRREGEETPKIRTSH